jgi:hypothetical protein
VTFNDVSAVDTTVSFPVAGSYVLQLTANDGELQFSDELSVEVSPPTVVSSLDVRVAASTDDAEQVATGGNINRTSSDLELVVDRSEQIIGVRFTGLTIPQGVNIVSAYVQFQVDETDSVPTTLILQGEATDNAETFGSGSADIISRARTTASVQWLRLRGIQSVRLAPISAALISPHLFRR